MRKKSSINTKTKVKIMSEFKPRKKIDPVKKPLILDVELKPKTKNQSNYIRDMAENDLVICSGPAGSGKTHCAVGMACEYLASEKVTKIILTRPMVQCGKGIGYLKGDVNEKVLPYMIPLLDEVELFLGPDKTKYLIAQNVIQIIPLELIRGRNFHNSFMILDECQNAEYTQLKMFCSRIGKDTKCVLSGDINQTDLIRPDFKQFIKDVGQLEGFAYVNLDYSDIQRSGFVGRLLSRLENNQ